MKFNIMVVKKWAAFTICGGIPIFIFISVILTMDLMWAIVITMIGIILAGLIASKLLDHPMLRMLEGKGLLVQTLDSTGVIDLFTVSVMPPYIRGNYRGKEINSMFDRDMVLNLVVPKEGKLVEAIEIDGETGQPCGTCTCLKLPTPEEKSDYLFSFGTFPTFIFNKNLGIFLSKEVLSIAEKDTMIKHVVLYLLRKTEELSQNIRDFARYIVEQTRPRKKLNLRNPYLWIAIIVIIIIVLGMLLFPAISSSIDSAAGGTPPLQIP